MLFKSSGSIVDQLNKTLYVTIKPQQEINWKGKLIFGPFGYIKSNEHRYKDATIRIEGATVID